MKPFGPTGLQLCFFKKVCATIVALAGLLLSLQTAQAIIVGPYTPDSNTLHLWHLDETSAPALDAVTNGLDLAGLLNAATLGNPSAPGFGSCLSTFDGGAGNIPTRGAGLFPTTSAGAPTFLTYCDPVSGAFTMEALICPQFNPADNLGTTNVGGNGRNNSFQIITGEASASSNRVWQFRFDPIGALTGAPYSVTNPNPVPVLEFINVNQGAAQSMPVPIPTNGLHAIVSNQWYHVAVTYSGRTNTAGNLKYYWTLLGDSNVCANCIGAVTMSNSLPAGLNVKPGFAIANQGRNDNGNWVGLMDEVRISSIARGPMDMMFAPSKVPTNISFVFTNTALTLSWPADHLGWSLQSQTNSLLPNNWSTVLNSAATNIQVINMNGARNSVFYRLVFP